MSNTRDSSRPLFNPAEQYPDRAQAVANASAVLGDRLSRCIVWLLFAGVTIVEFRGWNSGGVDQLCVTCVGSPKLHVLFSGECECQRRADLGNGPRRTWVAQKFGVRVEWEEASC